MYDTQQTTAEHRLMAYGKRLEPHLNEFFDRKIAQIRNLPPACIQMMEHLREFSLRGGKRLRPALMYYAFRCFSHEHDEAIVYASMSIELLHSYLLIHDDVMDNDSLRRNRPTLHTIYKGSDLATKFHSQHAFGVGMATIAGDLASSLAVDVLTTTNLPGERRLNALNKMTDVWTRVCHGQILDLHSVCQPDFTEDDALLVNSLKTGCYTIAGPLHLGGLLAGASPDALTAFDSYASPLGQAFQIRDDILGLFGNEQQLGKPIGSDLREGKKTLLILQALQRTDSAGSVLIHNALRNHMLTQADIAAVQAVVQESGSLDYCNNLASSLVEQAKAALPSTFYDEGYTFLIGIADFVVDRTT